jgi:protocatechuate 3,4-dioxygenase beta subunit
VAGAPRADLQEIVGTIPHFFDPIRKRLGNHDMTRPTFNRLRRKLLATAGVAGIAPHLAWAEVLLPTPRQSAGPFYPVQLPLDDDNDLTQIAGRKGLAKGQSTDLFGRIVDTNGRPLTGVRIEIWQCDANGRYHHPRDNQPVAVDENFQGHGHAITDANGSYRFRTIRPVYYPGRTPHIHAAVLPSGHSPLVTQIYIKDEPRNTRDYLFNSIPVERRSMVVAEFKPTVSGDTEFVAQFNLVIGATPNQAVSSFKQEL